MAKRAIVIAFLVLLPQLSLSSDNIFNVLDYGAAGDGKADDTQHFLNAWEEMCKSNSSDPRMIVPAGKTFLLNHLTLEGPCRANSSNFYLQVDGEIVGHREPSKWKCEEREGCTKWIHINHVDGLFINGTGTIHGRGQKWWHWLDHKRPSALSIANSKAVQVFGIQFKDNPHAHIVLDGLNHLHISNIRIEASGDSPNTDGINMKDSNHVLIDNSYIGTGDDCVSIVHGSTNVTIRKVHCGPGHGISIGSLGKDGSNAKVENIHVQDVKFNGTANGVRIKTWQGGKGYARNIVFEDIEMQNVDHPIIIDQFYCPDHDPCLGHVAKEAVQVSEVTYRSIWGTSKRQEAVVLACSETVPCIIITMLDINITTHKKHNDQAEDTTAYCGSVHGESRGVMHPRVPCLE